MLDYSELNELLRVLRSDADAADCHGFLCGQICVTEFPVQDIWKEYLDIKQNEEKALSEGVKFLHNLIADTIKSLESSEFEFHPVLPDDNFPIDERVAALGEWCHGFLNGFAISSDANKNMEDEDNRELIENFTQICHLGLGDEADENNEKALFELIEYVRMGAIFMYDQLSNNVPGRTHGIYH